MGSWVEIMKFPKRFFFFKPGLWRLSYCIAMVAFCLGQSVNMEAPKLLEKGHSAYLKKLSMAIKF